MDGFTSLVANRGRETDRPLPYSAQEWDGTSRIANSTALRFLFAQGLNEQPRCEITGVKFRAGLLNR